VKHYAFFRERRKSSPEDIIHVYRVKKNKLTLIDSTAQGFRDPEQAACDIIQSGEKWRAITMKDVPERLRPHVREISNGILAFKSGLSVNRVAFFYKEGMINLQRLN